MTKLVYSCEKRDLLADKEMFENQFGKALSDKYLREHGSSTREDFNMCADYVGYGICAVIDDYAEHWLYRAINAEQELQTLRENLKSIKKIDTFDTFEKRILICPVCYKEKCKLDCWLAKYLQEVQP